ncbi:MAG: hypothetical protein OXC63_06450 [Aestuariivita sp.]|nr:hypothetical protein [Aestuariivita sp.]MCY4346220.1 hypothetical protein [Aestuariivita sp.]
MGGGRTHTDIANIFEIGVSTVKQVYKDCVMDGLEAALETKCESTPKIGLSGTQSDEKLTVLASSETIAGDVNWTLELGGDGKVKLKGTSLLQFHRIVARKGRNRPRIPINANRPHCRRLAL